MNMDIFMRNLVKSLSVFAALVLFWGCTSCSTIDQASDDFPPGTETVRQAYVGYWEVVSLNDTTYYIYLRDDGKCFDNWEEGSQGEWRIRGERVISTWTNGWVDWLYFENGKYYKLSFAPEERLSHKSTGYRSAKKIKAKKVPKKAMLIINEMQKGDFAGE
jgi:hypothetical protein